MSLLPLSWVVIDAPADRVENRINGSFGRVMWVEDGGAVLTLVDEKKGAGDAWQIPLGYLLEVSLWPQECSN